MHTKWNGTIKIRTRCNEDHFDMILDYEVIIREVWSSYYLQDLKSSIKWYLFLQKINPMDFPESYIHTN